MMIHDNAVIDRLTMKQYYCCVPTDTNTVCRISNLFCLLFHRLCYENNGRNRPMVVEK